MSVPNASAESCARFSAEVAQLEKAVERRVRERVGRKPIHLEGYPAAGWVLADYVDFVVHVFSPESRELYQLEKLWGDAGRWYPEPPAAAGSAEAPGTA